MNDDKDISEAKPTVTKFLLFCSIILTGLLVALEVTKRLQLQPEAGYMLGILVAAALLWSTEAIPLFATSLMIIGAQIILLGNPGNWGFINNNSIPEIPYSEFLSPISDPIIILFLGGFILARVGVKAKVDVYLSAVLLRIFGLSAQRTLLGVICITTLFGMWISNTATTAMMVTLTGSLLAFVPHGNSFRKGLVLAIPFSANIGGIMTPISSPPNAIALGLLHQEGAYINFLTWMIIMLPLALVLLGILYFLLWFRYKPPLPLRMTPIEKKPFTAKGKFVVVIFSLTVLMWLTDSIHGIPAAVVALFPVITFTATGMLSAKEFNRIEWNILFIIAGGLSLGQGMNLSGLDNVLLGFLPVESEWIVLIIFMATLVLGTFMSNTTTAILFIPVAISLAQVMDHIQMEAMAMGLAVMAASSMALPISTPPNAIAYATNELTVKDFAINGSVISICSMFITYGYFSLLAAIGIW